MIALIGQLYREKNIVVSVYGRSLINRSVIQILKTHRRTRVVDVELSVVNTFPILEALAKLKTLVLQKLISVNLQLNIKKKVVMLTLLLLKQLSQLKVAQLLNNLKT